MDCTDTEFTKVTNVSTNDNYSNCLRFTKSYLQSDLLIYNNKLSGDIELMCDNDTDLADGAWSY